METNESFLQNLERLFRCVHHGETLEVIGRDGAGVHQRGKVHHSLPIFSSVNDDQYFFRQLLRLRKSKDFKEFVQGAESTGKNHQRLGQVGEPVLTHEEVVKLKIQ